MLKRTVFSDQISKFKTRIGFLVWYQVFNHMDQKQQNAIVDLIRESCKKIEQEINSSKQRRESILNEC